MSKIKRIERPHVSLWQVSKYFGKVAAIVNLTIEVNKGEFFSLLGPSGCGKTTLLRLIAGLEEPDSGTITIGEDIVAGGRWIAPEKRGVGIVFQDYALFPHMTVFKNIAFGLRGCSRQELKQKVLESLELVGLCGMASRYPHELSGGQQQRVALARALAPGPEVILLDEPFSNLDADLRTRIRAEVKGILSHVGATVIFVTHDQEEAFSMADRVAVMNEGRIEQIGSPEEIYHFPSTRFVADFVGQADFIDGVVEERGIVTEIGIFPNNTALARGTKIQLMIRPDDITFTLDGKGGAVVESQEFKGSENLYTLRLASGKLMHSSRPSTLLVEHGTRVRVTATPTHIVAFIGDEVMR